MVEGLQDRLSSEIDARARAELGLSFLYKNAKKDLSKDEKKVVELALAETKLYKGTEMADKILKKYSKGD